MRRKRRRKRYLSIIFVPDQEQDPRSFSMSYAKGRLVFGLMIFIGIHVVLGGIGYYRIFQLEKSTHTLQDENVELKNRNKKIEQIIRDFQEIRLFDEKIRTALSRPLGLGGQSSSALENLEVPAIARETSSEVSELQVSTAGASIERIQNRLYFLTEESGDYFDPEYFPTLLPVRGYLTTHFRKGGWSGGRSHYGIDIAAKKGSIIRAAGAGTVLLADWTPDYGNFVVIAHGRGLFSYYAHAMRLLVHQVAKVQKGDIIALLGNSGKSSAPHLHFEIWKDGEPLDPEHILFAAQSRKTGPGSGL